MNAPLTPDEEHALEQVIQHFESEVSDLGKGYYFHPDHGWAGRRLHFLLKRNRVARQAPPSRFWRLKKWLFWLSEFCKRNPYCVW